MASLEQRIFDLEVELKRLKLDANKRKFTKFSKDDTIFIARTFPDLNRIRVEPPAFGFVQFEEAYVEGVSVDENGVPSPEGILQLRPCARYFVLTYPPTIKITTLSLIDEKGHAQNLGVIGIYQPSAGIRGSVVYFDQDTPYDENYFSVGTPVGDFFEVKGVKTYVDTEGVTRMYGIEVDYQAQVDSNKLQWLEIKVKPPFGDSVDANAHVTPNGEVIYEINTQDISEEE